MNDIRLRKHLDYLQEELEEEIQLNELEKAKRDSEFNRLKVEQFSRLEDISNEISQISQKVEIVNNQREYNLVKHNSSIIEMNYSEKFKNLLHKEKTDSLRNKNNLLVNEISVKQELSKLKHVSYSQEIELRKRRAHSEEQNEKLLYLKEMNVVRSKENQYKQEWINGVEKLNAIKEEYINKEKNEIESYAGILDLQNSNELAKVENSRKSLLYLYKESKMRRLSMSNLNKLMEEEENALVNSTESDVEVLKHRIVHPFKYFKMRMEEDLGCKQKGVIFDLYDQWLKSGDWSESGLIQLGKTAPKMVKQYIDKALFRLNKRFNFRDQVFYKYGPPPNIDK